MLKFLEILFLVFKLFVKMQQGLIPVRGILHSSQLGLVHQKSGFLVNGSKFLANLKKVVLQVLIYSDGFTQSISLFMKM